MATPEEAADFRVEVTVDEASGGWVVASGRLRLGGIASAGWAARRAEWLLADHVLRRLGRFVHVHAAVVASDRRSLLVVGPSGRGKSTTAAALAQAGLTLYADDVALIRPETLRPVAFPRPVKLNAASRAMLRGHGLRVPDRARIGECIARKALPGLPAIDAPGPPIHAALFLAPERATTPSLRPLPAAEALLRAVSLSSTERIAASGPTAGVLALANAVPSYELTLGNPAETVALLLGLAAGAP
jgi:hypothetical protein